jgi:hypothetical protein
MNQFMTDEYVLAYHGPLLYEARVSVPIVIILDPVENGRTLVPGNVLMYRSYWLRIGLSRIRCWAQLDHITLFITRGGSRRKPFVPLLSSLILLPPPPPPPEVSSGRQGA